MERINTINLTSWLESFLPAAQTTMTRSLEQGQVLFFPKLAFELNKPEPSLLSPIFVCPKSKNISFDQRTQALGGVASTVIKEDRALLHTLLARFSTQAHRLVKQLFPHYSQELVIGRTSLRVVEITGRASSYRKDDKRLHVDAFPSKPNQGRRILRVFSNINTTHQPRVWRLGESFEEVVRQFLPLLHRPFPGSAWLLHYLKITKAYRSLYDHYMLQLHDKMKKDESYQQNADQEEIGFPANTTWVVQTDQVSHAAMSGQHLLEQTFYLPVKAMLDPNQSPIKILERFLRKKLDNE